MSKKVLVVFKYENNFEVVNGSTIVSKDRWKEEKKALKKYFSEIEFFVGGELYTFKNGKEFLKHITVHKLTKKQEAFVLSTFGETFGNINPIDF